MSERNPRITKVTTRNGDAGQTRLGNNQRISKTDPLVQPLAARMNSTAQWAYSGVT